MDKEDNIELSASEDETADAISSYLKKLSKGGNKKKKETVIVVEDTVDEEFETTEFKTPNDKEEDNEVNEEDNEEDNEVKEEDDEVIEVDKEEANDDANEEVVIKIEDQDFEDDGDSNEILEFYDEDGNQIYDYDIDAHNNAVLAALRESETFEYGETSMEAEEDSVVDADGEEEDKFSKLGTNTITAINNELSEEERKTLQMVAQLAESGVIDSTCELDLSELVENSSLQTVKIVPSETPGELSYVVFMSSDGNIMPAASDDFTFDITPASSRKRTSTMNISSKGMLMSQQYMCKLCNYSSPKQYLLQRHMRTHSEHRPYKCGVCERGFKTNISLQNHINTHTGTKPYVCRFCMRPFTTSGELVRHVRYKHTFEKPHKCTECGYAAVERSHLRRHIRCHTGERPYQCPHCTYASPDTYKLKRHIRVHTGEKPYECDICQSRFTQSNSLKAHKLIHSGNKPVFRCGVCSATCGRKTDLRIHMQKLHATDRIHGCKRCGKAFQDRYSYKIHIRSHEGEKCFRCDLCPYATVNERHLENHMYVHRDIKPFQCELCDAKFRQKQLLKRHLNLYHNPNYVRPEPQEKPNSCSICGKAFRHRGNLIRHFAIHDPNAVPPTIKRTHRSHAKAGDFEDFADKDEDDEVVVFEVIQLPSDKDPESNEISAMDESSLILENDDQMFSITDHDDEESIESLLMRATGAESETRKARPSILRIQSKDPKMQSARKSTQISLRNETSTSAQKNPFEILDFLDEDAIEKHDKELEIIRESQTQKDIDECFGFDDSDNDDDDLTGMKNDE